MNRLRIAVLVLLTATLAGCRGNTETATPGVFQRTTTVNGKEVRYTLSVPEGYSEDTPAPLVVALHYGGRVTPFYGGPILQFMVAPALKELNPIVVSPDSTGGDWSTAENEAAVMQIMDEAIDMYRIDPAKILVTGFSMGGTGTWVLASRHQDRFTAAIPIAGRPLDFDTQWKIPLYVIHSEVDGVVPIGPTRKYVEELQVKGFDVTFAPVQKLSHRMTMMYEKPLRESVPWLKKVWQIPSGQ